MTDQSRTTRRQLALGSAVALALLAACGGSSSEDRDSRAATGGSGGNSQGGGNAQAGAGGGAAASGSGGEPVAGGSGFPFGGTGAVTPINPPGPVYCGGTPCPAPSVCCMASGECLDPASAAVACAKPPPDDDGRQPCGSNAHCAENEFCMADTQLCQGTGHCQPIDNCGSCGGDCTVCGCDGNTYPDIQTACRAGVNAIPVGASGACGEPRLVGGGGTSGAGRELTPCAHDAQCGAGEACCAITGVCYPPSDPDRCRLPPPGTTFPCTANDQCWESEYCLGDGCNGPGGCVRRGAQEDCGVTLEPVCGCDGTTYTSSACAASRGVRVASDGECTDSG